MRLAEDLLYRVALPLYKRRSRDDGQSADPAGEFWQWQWDSSSTLIASYPGLQLTGKERLIDVGCGVGGRSCYIASRHAMQSMLAIDINAEEIEQAKKLQQARAPETVGKLELRAVDPHGWGLEPESFDVVLLVDVMEHVLKPRELLLECHQLLRRGGKLLFGTNGWYQYNAAHMIDLLPVPFITAMFSDETILNVVRRIVSSEDYIPCHWDSDPPRARYDGINDLRDRPGESLNKYTVADFERLVHALPFDDVDFRVLGPSKPPFRYLNALAKVPGVRELWHTYIVATLTK